MNPSKQTPESGAPEVPVLQLSQDERRVLELHDELRALEIKIALLKAQQNYTPDRSVRDTDEALTSAQQEAANAKASWLLRNDITDSVMTANPILKAVHGSKQTSPIENDLLPSIRTRDAASSTLAKHASTLQETLNELTTTEAENLRIARQNAELAAELLRLAEESERRRTGGYDPDAVDAPLKEETNALRSELKASRQKWKVMKGTVSAMVVGSGVDWVRDEQLRQMVLEPEDEV